MMRKIIALLLTLLLPRLLFAQTTEIPPTHPLVFTHVTVVDVTGAPSKSEMTVIVAGNRIAAVGKPGRVRIPKDAQVVDASGKFLIPGLWDMHAHALTDNRYEWVFPLLIANGVTGVREMGNNLPYERTIQLRREIEEGKLLGPRFGAATARILDGAGTTLNVGIAVETANEGRSQVREYQRQGIDFIKPYNLLSREVYLAIVDEARRQKIPVAGHVPFSMTAAEVSDLGQKSIEHTTDLFISCSRDEAALRNELRARAQAGGDSNDARRRAEMKAIAGYDERKAATLFARFVRNGTWQCPTLAVRRPSAFADLKEAEADGRLKYIPSPVRESWRNRFTREFAPLELGQRRRRFEKTLEIVSALQQARVGILAGTDIPNPYVFPGFSLHDELILLVQSGLTPLEALRAATINPAEFLSLSDSLGTVEKGKIADLVLLEADPLENISNTQRISAVVVNGRYLPKQKLQKLLAGAEAVANKK